MFEELERIIKDTGIGPGEVLSLAREVAGDGRLKSIDRLTHAERAELVAMIELLYIVAQ